MNPYKVLELHQGAVATETDIAKAYRQMALRFHPDRNPDGAEAFKRVSAAYTVLSDPLKKQLFDDHGVIGDDALTPHDPEAAKAERSTDMAVQVAQFYRTYAGSAEETEDLLVAFKKTHGDLSRIITEHALFDNGKDSEVRRIRDLLQQCIDGGALAPDAVGKRWAKTSADGYVQRIERRMKEEREEAEAALHAIHGADGIPSGSSQKGGGDMNSLHALIQRRQSDSFGQMLAGLEERYGGPSTSGTRKKKKGVRQHDEELETPPKGKRRT